MLARQAPGGRRFASASTNPDPAKAWSMYYTHENAYLNWVRNGATFTAVGMAFTIFKGQTEHAPVSLGGCVVRRWGRVTWFGGNTIRDLQRGSKESDGHIPGGLGVDISQRIVAHSPLPYRSLVLSRPAPRWLLGLAMEITQQCYRQDSRRLVFQLVAEARRKEFEEKSKPRRTGTRTGV